MRACTGCVSSSVQVQEVLSRLLRILATQCFRGTSLFQTSCTVVLDSWYKTVSKCTTESKKKRGRDEEDKLGDNSERNEDGMHCGESNDNEMKMEMSCAERIECDEDDEDELQGEN
jgi:hypothetical protein